MSRSALLLALLLSVISGGAVTDVVAQDAMENQLRNLEQRVDTLDRDLKRANNSAGIVLLLFGAFCALWAQNTNRNPWLWFFLGLFCSVVTVLVVLYKNARDRRPR